MSELAPLYQTERIIEVRGERFILKVETSSEPEDYRKYETIREEIWEFPEDHLSGTRNLLCENILHEGSSLFLAAFHQDPAAPVDDEAHLVGFAYGFVGVKDKRVAFHKQDNLWFYAQFLGVKDRWQGYGLGIALKEFQRDLVRDWLGIKLIVCTYDPLTAVNAYRNVHYFGMDWLEYRVAPYGEYGGRLNRVDVPSDRFFMAWDFASAKKPGGNNPELWLEEGRCLNQVEEILVEGKSGPVSLEVITGAIQPPESGRVLVRIPRDFYQMLRETDVSLPRVRQIPLAWRLKTRELFQALFTQGYSLADFFTINKDEKVECYYLLLKD